MSYLAKCALLLLILPGAAQAAADEPLGSSQQFMIDQIHRSLDNVDKDIGRFESADRESAAELALKGAARNLEQAGERIEGFRDRYPDLAGHSAFASAAERYRALSTSVPELASSASTPASTPGAAAPSPPAASSAPANNSVPKATDSGPEDDTTLTRKQKFELQQIGVALGNAESRITAFQEADRDDIAALALKAAERERENAREKLAAFTAANPDASGHADVAAARNRLDALGTAIASAETSKDAGSEDAATATADAEKILALRRTHADAMDVIHGRSVVYSDSAEAVSEAIAVIQDAETAADAMRPFLLEFQARYGSDEAEIAAALDAAGADADSANTRVAYNAAELYDFLEELENTRAVSAETVADNVAGRLSDIDDYSARIQQQRLDEAAEMVRLGQQIDPTNPRLNRLRGEVAQLSEAKRAEQMARVDTATWPDHVGGFEGPGSVDQLAESVREYLANDRDWGKSEQRPQDVLAVSVTGPWQVAAKDMFGQPIQWRLPVMVAITDNELRPDGIAQAFDLSMVAKEGAPNEAPKSPPWDGFWVGDNYYLKMGELP